MTEYMYCKKIMLRQSSNRIDLTLQSVSEILASCLNSSADHWHLWELCSDLASRSTILVPSREEGEEDEEGEEEE